MEETDRVVARHRDLKRYLDWDDRSDGDRLIALGPVLEPEFDALIDDFYAEISRHPDAASVITGGDEQVNRLKQSLRGWLGDLFRLPPDDRYAERCWRVGRRHAEIGLEPAFVIAAMARLRSALGRSLRRRWEGGQGPLAESLRSLDRRLDLDLALIQDAYQAENDDRLQRAERLGTLGQVAGGLAHELRNPLNVVKTSAYFLTHARAPSPEKLAEHLERIGRGVDRADAVITALSNFARLPAPERREVPLVAAVREAIDADPPGEGIEPRLEVPGGLAVEVDPGQLQIVLGNLVRNACEAMPGGGTLTLRARRVGDGRVELEVEDTGVGMSPELRGRVTEPLYSTKARGLGLGLSLTRAILEKNGGSLRIDSEPGVGSTFTVALPESRDAGGPRP
ncbi:sensor histidine kinase [Tautonia plasticadhaerens]|uniref:histidine kinase n=1 Tax=Tautonia plasticadhaerens TaxID=2527974 RepID=A0A518H7S4_9BACT|nr:protoglobin domain-containing protein [Tautonia plasticadhaerens]QDV36841.1 Globin-coupled histidine kinase [Tautonia plasticadhaerens]